MQFNFVLYILYAVRMRESRESEGKE